MRHLSLTCAAAFLMALGCNPSPASAGDDAILGAGLGAALGGLFGSQIGHGGGQLAAAGIGVALGGLIGNDIGQSMDAENAHPRYTGPRYAYVEPAPIIYDAYTPNYVAPPSPPPIYIDEAAGTYCREYSQTLRIDGRMHESFGTACLQPDGSWRVTD